MMKDLPNPFWAFLFMLLGCLMLLAVLFKVTSSTSQLELGVLMAVATAGTSIISGAFGYIQGRKEGDPTGVNVPVNPDVASRTTVETTTPGKPVS
jgi:hypothetical protein